MDLKIGSVVISKAGHDSGEMFAVMSIEDKNVFLSDGRQRKVEKPKKKNLKHIAVTTHIIQSEYLQTNRKLKKALAAFKA